MQDPDPKCRHFGILWHFLPFYGILAFLPKSLIRNRIRFFRFYPIFSLFPTSRLSDSTALVVSWTSSKLLMTNVHNIDATRQAWNVEHEDRAVLVEQIPTHTIDLQFQTRVFQDFPVELPKTPGILDSGFASA